MRRFSVSLAAAALLWAGAAWAMPWMFQPTNQHGSVGNTYDEYQTYGSPYFHDGTDVMQNSGGVHVYSCTAGYMTHETSGTQYGGLMIGDQYAAGAPGWLYWHLPNSTYPFNVGDRINVGDYIGDIATWPVSNFHHTHFSKVVGTSGLPWGWYQPTGDPLDYLTPSAEPDPPEIHDAVGTNLLAFCTNNTSLYLNPTSLSGDIDIIAKLGDHILNPQWEVTPRRITYSIRGGSLFEQHLAFQFGDPLPGASYVGFCSVVYKDDPTCNSEGNYTYRNFFFILTNNDGDSIIETSDTNGKWATDGYPGGAYTVAVSAWDCGGNVSTDSMEVYVASPRHNVSVALTPTSSLILPETGGSFTYTVNIHNNETAQIALNGWINMTYPDGHIVQVMLRNLNLPGGATATREMTQTIAGSEPNGNYSYIGYVGLAPYNSWDTSGFDFTKGVDKLAGNWVSETRLEGWDYESALTLAAPAQPETHSLLTVSPNPFNPVAVISYQLSTAGPVSLQVYDTAGRRVITLVDGIQAAGAHEARFDGSKLATGIYLVKLMAGEQAEVQKIVLMK